MNRTVRCGVVGLGKMGVLHSSLVNTIHGARLSAVCEPGGTMRGGFETFVPAVPVYRTHDDMLKKEELDAVFICTPPSSHIGIALDCIRQGCHVFIEKPLSLNAEAAAPLLDLLAQTSKVSMVGYMMRFTETFRKAHELVSRGVLGKMITCQGSTKVSQMFKTGKGWRFSRKESGGGVLIAQGIHAVDLMCWMIGIPRSVNARSSSFYSGTVEDFVSALFSWGDGTIGCLNSSWSVDGHRMMETSLEMNGENGSMVVDDDSVRLFLRKKVDAFQEGWTVYTKPELFSGVAIDIGGPQYTRQDDAFIQAILGEGTVENDVRNAYKIQRVLDGLYQSADSDGATIQIR